MIPLQDVISFASWLAVSLGEIVVGRENATALLRMVEVHPRLRPSIHQGPISNW